MDLMNGGMRESGVYYLQIRGTTYWFLKVFCEQNVADGGWTVSCTLLPKYTFLCEVPLGASTNMPLLRGTTSGAFVMFVRLCDHVVFEIRITDKLS